MKIDLNKIFMCFCFLGSSIWIAGCSDLPVRPQALQKSPRPIPIESVESYHSEHALQMAGASETQNSENESESPKEVTLPYHTVDSEKLTNKAVDLLSYNATSRVMPRTSSRVLKPQFSFQKSPDAGLNGTEVIKSQTKFKSPKAKQFAKNCRKDKQSLGLDQAQISRATVKSLTKNCRKTRISKQASQ